MTPVGSDQPKIVVLISGNGSNLQAIINAAESGQIKGHIAAVISNRADAYGLKRAQNAGIAQRVIDHSAYSDRKTFDQALADTIDSFEPALVVLAGFMRILSTAFVERYAGRLINIHPSLLPKYRGLHTHRRALEAGDATHGASVHFVTAELDGGPVILQGQVPILEGDTEQTLADRVLILEHRIYPIAVEWFAEKRIQLDEKGVLLDQELLPDQGYQIG